MNKQLMRIAGAFALAIAAIGAVSAQDVTTAVIPVYSDPVEAAGTVLLMGHVLGLERDLVAGARWRSGRQMITASTITRTSLRPTSTRIFSIMARM